ncbi:FecR family protein, partial [Steroidobacter sp.]|uniref:FecR family protein n=1 Tax=Steroidobacter sp. TaxID=1978227 RepID=UPI001A403A91
MSTDASEMKPAPTPAEIDEAAVWIARLHAPNRTLQVERGFRRWMAERPSHAAAFETVSTGWELSGMLERRPFPRVNRWQRAGFREGFVRATLAVAATVVLVVGALVAHQVYTDEVKTSVGEQRTVTLEDGSRMTLNTTTRVAVNYDEHARRVELKSGEALFEVTKQERPWPFIVTVGDKTITAVGTAFVVRADAKQTSVFMVEGEVVVAPAKTMSQAVPASQSLTIGQRLT